MGDGPHMIASRVLVSADMMAREGVHDVKGRPMEGRSIGTR